MTTQGESVTSSADVIINARCAEVRSLYVYLTTRLRVDFERRFKLSSLTRRQNRSRSFRTFRLISVAVVDAAVVVRYTSQHTHVLHVTQVYDTSCLPVGV